MKNLKFKSSILSCIFICLFLTSQTVYAQNQVIFPVNNEVVYSDTVNLAWEPIDSEIKLEIFIDDLLYKDTLVTGGFHQFVRIDTFARYKINFYEDDKLFSCINIFQANVKNINNQLLWYRSDNGMIFDSLNRVSEWKNSFNSPNSALQSLNDRKPLRVKSVNILNGKPVVRFDGLNDFMAFSELRNIKTAVFILKHATGMQDSPAILGHPSFFHFHGGAGALLFRGVAGFPYTLINNGLLRLNKTQSFVTTLNKPQQFSIISMIPSDSMTASFLTNDRNQNGRFWNGDFVEIILLGEFISESALKQIENYLHFKYAPPVYLGLDTVVETGRCPVVLGEKDRFVKYLWSTGDTTPTLSVNKTGSYWLTATDVFGFESTDTVKVTYMEDPKLLPNSSFCFGSTVIWDAGLSNSTYLYRWSTGSTDSEISISSSTNISLTVLDKSDTVNCRFDYGPINFTMDEFGTLDALGTDTTLCKNSYFSINPTVAEQTISYLWSDGATEELLTVDTSGRYSVVLKNAIGCSLYDTVQITVPAGSEAPIISFTGPDTLCMGSTYTFTENSLPGSGIISAYRWDFGDGDSAFFKSVNKTFEVPGDYFVNLSLNTSDGCANRLSKNITVIDLPSPNFTVPALNCAGNQIPFTDISNERTYTPLSYRWIFGNPTSGANDTSLAFNPTHIYSNGGTYQVNYQLTDRHGCKAGITKPVTIQNAPIPNFAPGTACSGSFVNITDLTTIPSPLFATTYNWDLGDGTFNSTRGSIQKNYGTPGTKTVKLTVTANNGCKNEIPKSLTVNPVPVANFGITNLCAGRPSLITDSSKVALPDSIISSVWRLSGAIIGSGKSIAYTFNTAGTVTIDQTVSTNHCAATTFKTIEIKTTPQAAFDFSPKFGAPPLEVTFSNNSVNAQNYQWKINGQSIATDKDLIYVLPLQEDYNITLLASSTQLCTDSVSRIISVRPDSADLAVKSVVLIKKAFGEQAVVDIENRGNVTLTGALVSVYGKNPLSGISKEWKGELPPGSSTAVDMGVAMPFDTERDFICAKTELTEGIDRNESNDVICSLFNEKLKVYQPYPLPVRKDFFTLPLLLPESSDIELSIHDITGKTVLNHRYSLSRGFHHLNVSVSGLNIGMYAIIISSGLDREIRKILIEK